VAADQAPARRRSAAIPVAPLIAATAFGRRLSAAEVAAALARGLRAGGLARVELCALQSGSGEGPRPGPAALAALLAGLDFDARMRSARAVVLAERRLEEQTLRGSVAFEIATRARQAGVPCYAVTARSGLDSFDARMLDLQLVLQARDGPALRAAGRRLATVLRPPQP
jgi:glycerate kinase